MMLLVLGVKYVDDPRAKYLHNGPFLLKFAIWGVFLVVPFLLPLPVMSAYAWVARICSGLFLVLQLIIILDFA